MNRHFLLLLTLLLLNLPAFASNSVDRIKDKKQRTAHFESKMFSHLNISAGITSLGLTLEATTPIHQNLKLRGGFDFFNYTTNNFTIDLEDTSGAFYEAFGFTPDLRTKGDIKLFHTHLLVDYYPFRKGILYLTGGVYLGTSKIKVNGQLQDKQGQLVDLLNGEEWPTIDFDGHIIDLNNGILDAELKLGNTIKPYFGIGLGRSVSKRRLGFKFEIGAIYQGDYTLKQNNKTIITSNEATAYVEDSHKYTKWLKWWPKVAFQLNYRIF